MVGDPREDGRLSAADRSWLTAVRSAESLTDLVDVVAADSEHDAYFDAKRKWSRLRGAELAREPRRDGIPGNRVVVDGRPFVVHGITHADTDAERAFLHEHVTELLDEGATVYCEQGIRPMYFSEFPRVCAMDDYRWAIRECERRDLDSHLGGDSPEPFDSVTEDFHSLWTRLQDPVFSLIESGTDVYGEAFAAALGDVVSTLLTSHETMATGEDFTSFSVSRRAAEDPTLLRELQHYYERRFLPQPIEREWLRRHDAELEIVTHARNERMADYAVYHADGDGPVHLVVGAAHQPGITYYLDRYRTGARTLGAFEPVP